MSKIKEEFTKKMNIENIEELNLKYTPAINGLIEYFAFLEYLDKNSLKNIETTKSKTNN